MGGRNAWLAVSGLCISGLTAGLAYAYFDRQERLVEVRVGPAAPLTSTVADSPEERNAGLMDVEQLRPREGMIFVFDRREPVTFYMYRTLVPLSLAFVDGDRVVGVEEMRPCPEENADRCPRYLSPSAVTHAIEASEGFFSDAGVTVGDRMIVRDLE